MPMSIQEQVLGFEIAIYDILGVQVFEGERHFGCVELGDRVGESLEKHSVSQAYFVVPSSKEEKKKKR